MEIVWVLTSIISILLFLGCLRSSFALCVMVLGAAADQLMSASPDVTCSLQLIDAIIDEVVRAWTAFDLEVKCEHQQPGKPPSDREAEVDNMIDHVKT